MIAYCTDHGIANSPQQVSGTVLCRIEIRRKTETSQLRQRRVPNNSRLWQCPMARSCPKVNLRTHQLKQEGAISCEGYWQFR
jgi:hypothetical protein